jgi:hypothetical protein
VPHFQEAAEIIFKLPAENARTQGKQPFSDLHGYFRDDVGGPTGEHRERANSPQFKQQSSPQQIIGLNIVNLHLRSRRRSKAKNKKAHLHNPYATFTAPPRPARNTRCRSRMDGLTAFGLLAVTAMLVTYALEDRSPWFILAFAGACALGSGYGFLQGAWPFGLVEAIWALVAAHRWWLKERG